MKTKLKKLEEDLKLQDAKSSSKNDDSRKLEDYLERTEVRNVETEATIRTLQRNICLLEKDSQTVSNITGPPGMSSTYRVGRGSKCTRTPDQI